MRTVGNGVKKNNAMHHPPGEKRSGSVMDFTELDHLPRHIREK